MSLEINLSGLLARVTRGEDSATQFKAYKELGSGIKRALEDWPAISFTDDRDGCLFTATVHRKPVSHGATVAKASVKRTCLPNTPGKKPGKRSNRAGTPGKTPGKILDLLSSDPTLSIPALAQALSKSESAIERAVRKLRISGRLRRIGPDKGGHWEAIDKTEG